MSLSNVLEPARSIIDLGGPIVAILAVMSVLSLAVILVKLFGFWTARIGHTRRATQAIEMASGGDIEKARDYASRGRSGAAVAVSLALSMIAEGRFNKAEIEEEVSRFALDHLHRNQFGFRFLDTVVQLSPLLGLFGTVLGMIEAFQKLQGAGNAVDPSALAGGIWVALLTTAVGLAVAMPVSIVLTYLESRLENDRVAIETTVSALLSPRTAPVSLTAARRPHAPVVTLATRDERSHAH
ncbi:MotA/TolQ/ExbB proton channel family protein [Consotaella salsifontis]|uniref:Outer membrane transport energization protein ExbB n=1 Tax=Consotaella salsifontis TaxID=1365950 RepID=A0A1T4TE46_9HYPH|nr:MotA/TolQ/ExbB proton channel family protein [Consotaella salsifontis]SKA38732.1 outer membrane transport energization protein ExbB [Consotaella salsifontis]